MRPIFTSLFLLLFTVINAQPDSGVLTADLANLDDQYGVKFDKSKAKETFTVIYLPGIENPFQKVLDKLKGRLLKDPQHVQIAAGLREQIQGIPESARRQHMQDGVVASYGKDHFSILLDYESRIADRLKLKGWSILTVTKNGKVAVKDYGTDRKTFLDDLNNFFK